MRHMPEPSLIAFPFRASHHETVPVLMRRTRPGSPRLRRREASGVRTLPVRDERAQTIEDELHRDGRQQHA